MSVSKEYREFDRILKRLIAVPRDELQRRLDRYREQAEQNPRKRGPKPRTIKGR